MATNLYEFYTGQGKALPTIQERGVIFEQQGLGKASDYKGTASQNTALLGKLDPNSFKGKTPTSYPTVLTSGSAKKAVDNAVAGIGAIQTAKPKTSADYGKELESIAPEYEDLAGDFIRQINDVRNGIIQYTPDEKAQLDFIQNSVIRARQAQEKFNRQAERGVRMLPTGEFAPVRGMSALNQTIQGGLDELKNIDLEGAAKLGEARQAIRDKRFDEIVKTYGELQGLLDKRTQVFKDLRDNAFNAEKFAYQQEQDARDYELKLKESAARISKIKSSLGGGSTGIIPGVKDQDAQLVSLLKDYRDFIADKTALGLMTKPKIKAQADSLISQITAEYKQAKKLGTLDAGVQKLMDGILGKSGISKYSVDAQVGAVDEFLNQLGYQDIGSVDSVSFLDQLPGTEVDNQSFFGQ